MYKPCVFPPCISVIFLYDWVVTDWPNRISNSNWCPYTFIFKYKYIHIYIWLLSSVHDRRLLGRFQTAELSARPFGTAVCSPANIQGGLATPCKAMSGCLINVPSLRYKAKHSQPLSPGLLYTRLQWYEKDDQLIHQSRFPFNIDLGRHHQTRLGPKIEPITWSLAIGFQ